MKMKELVCRAVRQSRSGAPVRLTETGEPAEPHVPEPPEPEEEEEPDVWECPECGNQGNEEDDAVIRGDGTHACSDRHCSVNCPNCDEYYAHGDGVTVAIPRRGQSWRTTDVDWCPSCADSHAFQCADCDSQFSQDVDSGENASGDTVCHNCRENYFGCDRCGETYHNDRHHSDGICDSCHEDEEEEEEEEGNSDLIHQYSYKPRWVRHGDEKQRHYGVELETVLKEGDLDDAARETLDLLNDGHDEEEFAFLKKDGSLDGGVGSFEIVTHPATLPFHREQWQNFFKNRPKALVSHDAPCSCGLHVHVEKKGLSDLSIFKMVAFVNSQTARKFVEAIARRSNNHYAKIAEKKAADVKNPSDRYEAINLTNSHTVEFRLFKGTLNKDSFMRSLEFADAVTEFGKDPATGLQQVHGTRSFFDFVAKRSNDWPLLHDFIQNFRKKEISEQAERTAKEYQQYEPSLSSAQLHRE